MNVLRTRRGPSGPRLILVVLGLALSSLLAACGTTTPTSEATPPPAATATTAAAADTPTTAAAPAGTPTTASGGGQTIEVSLGEWFIEPKAIDTSGGPVTFNITNKGNLKHDFVILNGPQQLSKSKLIGKGETTTMTVNLAAGSYTTLCDIVGHKDAGMAGTLGVK